MRTLLALIAGLLLAAPATAAAAQTPNPAPAQTPLAHTHAHNDYQHDHPLFDALSHRFSSVEADIWLAADGSLLVGHDKDSLQHGRTLEALYLDPLMELVQRNGGHVYAGSTAPLQLLVDVKNTGTATYTALDARLRTTYRSVLTSWTRSPGEPLAATVEHPGPVTVVISGDRDRALMAAQDTRYAAYDGRLSDLGDGTPATFIPLISDNWSSAFKWKGTGPMPAGDRARLQDIVRQAHANHQQVRFWATPDRSASQYLDVWREELDAGVDWLNTDELGPLEQFLTG
jgi:glycerophosphoryl diester phosphodiesterase